MLKTTFKLLGLLLIGAFLLMAACDLASMVWRRQYDGACRELW